MVVPRFVCFAPGEIGWKDVEVPTPGPGEALVRHTIGVEKHGTMTAFVKGYANERGAWDSKHHLHRREGLLWDYPVPLGNCQVGEIVEVGPDVDLAVGSTVVHFAPFQPEIVARVADVVELPLHVDPYDALMLDPGEFAFGAIRDGGIRLGDAVAVFGLGAIGLATVQLARRAGASKVIAIDPVTTRREAARECGADVAIDPSGDPGLILRELTDMRGVDVAIDFSGSPHALQAALRGVAYGGTIVYGAFPPPFGAGLDFGGEAHMNRLRLVFSRACSDPNPDHPRWDWMRIRRSVLDVIFRGGLRSEAVIDPPIAFADLPTEYPKIASDPTLRIKLSVVY